MVKKTSIAEKLPWGTILASFVANNWPWLLSVLATVAQIIEQLLPWPVFFLVLAVLIAITFLLINQYDIYRDNRRLDNKLTVGIGYIFQMPDPHNKELCQYQLFFRLVNVHNKPLYSRVAEMTWDYGSKSASAINIEESKMVLPPGPTDYKSPTIGGLAPGHYYGGHFKLRFRLGFEFDEEINELEVRGSIKTKNKVSGRETIKLTVTSNITKFVNEKIS